MAAALGTDPGIAQPLPYLKGKRNEWLYTDVRVDGSESLDVLRTPAYDYVWPGIDASPGMQASLRTLRVANKVYLFIHMYNITAKGRIALYIIHHTEITETTTKYYTKMGREKEG